MSEGDYLAYQRATAAGKLDEARDSSPPVYVRLTDETEWPRKGSLNFVDNQVDRWRRDDPRPRDFPQPGLL
jgi:hypothetical protein